MGLVDVHGCVRSKAVKSVTSKIEAKKCCCVMVVIVVKKRLCL